MKMASGRCCFLLAVFVSLALVCQAQIVRPSPPPPLNVTKKAERVLTGNPQVDYKTDPNLPRELNGFDLSDYPFYNRLPPPDQMFNFSCDDRHDGFYASIPHKCQVYHHCLFGQRFDFLCANFTAFDQSNFICHFASEVDCKNSENYYFRNDELYVEASTTTAAPVTPEVKIVYIERESSGNRGGNRPRLQGGGRRKRPPPQEVDYYDDYYDTKPAPKKPAPLEDDYYYYEDEKSTTSTTRAPPRSRQPVRQRIRTAAPPEEMVDTRVRPLSRIRPSGSGSESNVGSEAQFNDDTQLEKPRQQTRPLRKRRRKRPTTTTTTQAADEYYDDYYYYDDEVSTTTAKPKRKRPKLAPENRRLSLVRARDQSPLLPRNVEIEPLEDTPPERNVGGRRGQSRQKIPLEEVDIVLDEAPIAAGVDLNKDEYVYDTDIPAGEKLASEATTAASNRRPGSFVRPRSISRGSFGNRDQ